MNGAGNGRAPVRHPPALQRLDQSSTDLDEPGVVEEWLRLQSTALAAADNGIVITDTEGTMLWVNPSFTRLTGYRAEEAVGRTPRLLRSGKQDDALYKELWETILAGKVWSGELINRRKDGSLYVEEQTITPVRDAHGKVRHFIAIKHDVTERRLAEKEVRRLNEELEQRVRLRTAELTAANRELESFSFSVSHDLRAPLRSIRGFGQALLEDCGSCLDENGQGYLQRILAASERMERLIGDLLNLSRVARSDFRPEAVDLSALAGSIAEELRTADPQRRVSFVIAPSLMANGDLHLLRVALQNLLGNAWKYTSKHAEARIEFGRIAEEHGSGGAEKGTSAAPLPPSSPPIFFVRDDGAGFDMSGAANLFGPFRRLHAQSEFEGTGIGLATVQRIIHRHGGRIWAEGAVEQGVTFYFTLEPPAPVHLPTVVRGVAD